MSDAGNEDGDRYQFDLTERQRERFEAIRDECKEADPGLPAPSDEQLFSSLLDTWDAVGDGLYSDADGPEWPTETPILARLVGRLGSAWPHLRLTEHTDQQDRRYTLIEWGDADAEFDPNAPGDFVSFVADRPVPDQGVSAHLDAERRDARLFDALEELAATGELRLEEFTNGWRGYVKRGDVYYWVDTRESDRWPSELRVTLRGVINGIERAIEEGWSP